MITRTNDRETIVARIEEFLNDLRNQIVVEDNETPRVIYTAMTYKLSGYIVGVIRRQGIIQYDGWLVKWRKGEVAPRMVLKVREAYLEQGRMYVANAKKRHKAR